MANSQNNPVASRNIHCANCLHCKVFLERAERGTKAEHRVRCAAMHWHTSSGKERTFCYHTVLNRRVVACPDYDSMGERDRDEFLKDLRDNLPVERDMVDMGALAVGAHA